jgi:hypothetical protein
MTAADDGLPELGRSARKLGVRPSPRGSDAASSFAAGRGPFDVFPDAEDNISPGTGGLSVNGTVEGIPPWRRPSGLDAAAYGPWRDAVFAVDPSALEPSALLVRPEEAALPLGHAFVEPVRRMALSVYEAGLAATRAAWTREWP